MARARTAAKVCLLLGALLAACTWHGLTFLAPAQPLQMPAGQPDAELMLGREAGSSRSARELHVSRQSKRDPYGPWYGGQGAGGADGPGHGNMVHHRVPQLMANQRPKWYKIKLIRRQPNLRLSVETIMQRITTCLIKNMAGWRGMSMSTLELAKDIGMRGKQIHTNRVMNMALDLLRGQRVIRMIKDSPKRWEIHEAYREFGVPPISWDPRNPWKLCHLLKFEQTSVNYVGSNQGERYTQAQYAAKLNEDFTTHGFYNEGRGFNTKIAKYGARPQWPLAEPQWATDRVALNEEIERQEMERRQRVLSKLGMDVEAPVETEAAEA